MIFSHSNYRDFLRSTLADARAKNPRFSLRSWATKIGVTPAMLSAVLLEKKNFSRSALDKIAKKLKLADHEKEYLLALGDFESADETERESLLEKLERFRHQANPVVHSTELFRSVSDWYAVAMLEWSALPGGLAPEDEMARRLNLPLDTVLRTRQKLYQYGFIRKDSQGIYRKGEPFLRFAMPGADDALRNFHRQMLARASVYLDIHAPSERYIGTETFPFDADLLPKARAIIDRCLDDLVALSRKSKSPDNVFHVGIQFFKLLDEPTRKQG